MPSSKHAKSAIMNYFNQRTTPRTPAVKLTINDLRLPLSLNREDASKALRELVSEGKLAQVEDGYVLANLKDFYFAFHGRNTEDVRLAALDPATLSPDHPDYFKKVMFEVSKIVKKHGILGLMPDPGLADDVHKLAQTMTFQEIVDEYVARLSGAFKDKQ